MRTLYVPSRPGAGITEWHSRPGAGLAAGGPLCYNVTMPGQSYTPVRLPPDLRRRVDALAKRLASVPEVAAAAGPKGVGVSLVVRLALLEGLPALEAKYGARRGR